MSQVQMPVQIPIFMYHQIDRIPPKVDANGVRAKFRSLIVSPASFARQMWLLKKLGFRGVSMSELMPYLRGEKTITNDGKVVGITFDDGYQNNLTYALPVLKQYGFSSTCYAVSGLAGQSNRWDADQSVSAKPLMTAAEMREWMAGGQEIGSHTQHHTDLLAVDTQLARAEIFASKTELEAMTGVPCQHFCYPYGRFNASHVAMAQEAGYESATTTKHGYVDSTFDAFELPRIGVMKNTNFFQFARRILFPPNGGMSPAATGGKAVAAQVSLSGATTVFPPRFASAPRSGGTCSA
jgi:peptidoglycan/xylan/chitin deacetylase (PgdA/CDA1 family)